MTHSVPVDTISACATSSTENAARALDNHLSANAEDILFVQARSEPWLPALRSEEAIARHVALVQLEGVEIAVWRADDGTVNAWENRCPHRGTRLTIGTNAGLELVCRYHGWRFATGSGMCTAIPAHPGQTPPRAARVLAYDCSEKYGLIWVRLGQLDATVSIPRLEAHPTTTLRSVAMSAPAAPVADALRRDIATTGRESPDDAGAAHLVLLVVAQDAASSVVHGIIDTELRGEERTAVLHAMNERLKGVRNRVVRV
jgi:nitrite reductase/ring-hydroxylating ferredoxin subunit